MTATNKVALDGDSSSEEDEEERARMAAFQSVAIDSSAVVGGAKAAAEQREKALKKRERAREGGGQQQLLAGNDDSDGEGEGQCTESGGLRISQIRTLELLHKHLDKTFGISFRDEEEDDDEDTEAVELRTEDKVAVEQQDGEGCRLFSRGPAVTAIVEKEPPVRQPYKGRTSRRDYEGDAAEDPSSSGREAKTRAKKRKGETKEEMERRFRSVAVEPGVIFAEAARLNAEAKARAERLEQEEKEREREEEERVRRLKEERGELWLPSVLAERAYEEEEETLRTALVIRNGTITSRKKTERKQEETPVIENGSRKSLLVVENGTHSSKKKSLKKEKGEKKFGVENGLGVWGVPRSDSAIVGGEGLLGGCERSGGRIRKGSKGVENAARDGVSAELRLEKKREKRKQHKKRRRQEKKERDLKEKGNGVT